MRTVLFRYFLRDPNNQTRARERLPLKELSLERSCEFMQPIYLFYLVGSSATLYRITGYLFGSTVTANRLTLFFAAENGQQIRRPRRSQKVGALLFKNPELFWHYANRERNGYT